MDAVAIDPVGCGCTECLTGEYVALDAASPDDLIRLVRGKADNNTGMTVPDALDRWRQGGLT